MSNITTNATMFILGVAIAFGLVHVLSPASANPSDVFESQCADCHYLSDFEGVDAADLIEFISGIVDGTQNHPPTELTAEDAALMAEYLANQ